MKKNATIYDLRAGSYKDVKKLFKQIVDEDLYQDSIYLQIKNALSAHMAGERKSSIQGLKITWKLVEGLESYEEHDVGKKVINDIDNSTDKDVKLAKVKVLSEAIDQHIKRRKKATSSRKPRKFYPAMTSSK